MNSKRRLAAILFADIAGYTAMMQSDEGKAMNKLRHYQTVLKRVVAQCKGEIIKNYGDGSLCLFTSVLDAVHCAKALQETFRVEPVIPLRIGLHLGDVMYEENDIYGNSINVASRIESMGIPGAVLMSKNVLEKVKNQADLKFETLGSFDFKNVEEPMEVYALANEGIVVPKLEEMKGKLKLGKDKRTRNWIPYLVGVLAIPLFGFFYFFIYKATESSLVLQEKKSIAVLPFKNWSGDENLEYFCDGMTDEIIARLTKISAFEKVTSRTSVFKYKNSEKSIPEIAEELDVNHILEGSFQKVGEQIKIQLQLIDAPRDDHFWSDEYSGNWQSKDVFKIQAEVAENVIRRLELDVSEAEISSVKKAPTENETAWNLYTQAEFQRYKSNEQAIKNAAPLYEQAIALDSSFVDAYISLALSWTTGGLAWGVFSEKQAKQAARKLLNKALKLEPNNYRILVNLAHLHFYYEWDFNFIEDNLDELVSGIQSSSEATGTPDYLLKTGRPLRGLSSLDSFIKKYPSSPWPYTHMAKCLYLLGREAEAVELLQSKDALFEDDQWYLRETAHWYFIMNEVDKSKQHVELLNAKFVDRAPIHIWLNALHKHSDGDRQASLQLMDEIKEMYLNNVSGSPAWFISMYHFYLKDKENGFLWLQRSYDRHEVEMTWLKEEPFLKSYKNDPRYVKLFKAMGFPEVLN